MASSLLGRRLCYGVVSPLKQLKNSEKPIHATTRRRLFSTFDSILSEVALDRSRLLVTVSPSVVALKSYFPSPGTKTGLIEYGTGTFVDPKLIVTSAQAVGRVSADRSSCQIGRTVAFTVGKEVLSTRVLAVNFGGDVAVLMTETETIAAVTAGKKFPIVRTLAVSFHGHVDEMEDRSEGCSYFPVANEIASKELPLLLMSAHEKCKGTPEMQIKDRKKKDRYDIDRGRREWAYPVGDEYGWTGYGREFGKDNDAHVTSGSPWFSLDREIVGIASDGSAGGFVVPPPRIRSLLHYAKTKAPHDPIVVDPWITSHTISDVVLDDMERCFGEVGSDNVTTVYDSVFGF